MINTSATFGMVSSLASMIRWGFHNYINNLQDAESQGRLTGDLNRILQEVRDPETRLYRFHADTFKSLEDFNFNIHSPQKKWLLVDPQLTFQQGEVKLNWPSGKPGSVVKFHANASICKISMVLTFFRLQEGIRSYCPTYQHFLLKSDEEVLPVQEFTFAIPEGCFCVLGLFQSYSTYEGTFGQLLNTKKFSPSAIRAAIITPGTYVEEGKFRWTEMKKLKFMMA